MTDAVTHSFGEFLLKIGAGADALECGLTSKNWKIAADVAETSVPKCDSPDAPVWPSRVVRGLSFDAAGSGVADSGTSFEQIRSWIMGGTSQQVKIYPAGASGGYFLGNFIASSFGNDAAWGEKTKFDFAIQSNGEVTWTPGS